MSAPVAVPSAAAAEAKQPEKSVRGQFFAPEKGSAESVTAGVGEKPAHAPCGLAEKAPPLQQIGLYFCAFHNYASEPHRHILAHHFCSHVSAEMHQCIIYDSNQPNARLMGIEYLISERMFNTLPEEERKFWHSHQYESGMLVATGIPDATERAVMQEIANMYGKTIHTWQVDRDPLPLGPPSLMMSLTHDNQLLVGELEAKDKVTGVVTAELKARRTDLDYRPRAAGVDQWETSGNGIEFQPALVDVRAKEEPATGSKYVH